MLIFSQSAEQHWVYVSAVVQGRTNQNQFILISIERNICLYIDRHKRNKAKQRHHIDMQEKNN